MRLTFNNIDRVGVELEGYFADTSPVVTKRKLVGDGSVKVSNAAGGVNGEYRSRPMKSMNNLRKDIIKNYPARVNETCGLHIHFSLKEDKATLILLAGDDFCDKVNVAINDIAKSLAKKYTDEKQFANMERRIAGNCSYAGKGSNLEYYLTHQEEDASGHRRYRQINCLSMNKHKTIEIRTLPMFSNAEFASTLIRKLVIFIDRYLTENINALKLEVKDAVIVD